MVGALFYKSLMFIKRSFKETAWIGFAYVWFFGLLLVKPYWTLAPLVGFQSLELFLYSGAVLTISMQFYSLIVRDDIRSGVLQRVCLERRPLLSYLMGAAALPAMTGLVFGISLVAVYCAVDVSAASALMQNNIINVIFLMSGIVALAVSSAPPWGLVFGDSDDMQIAYIARCWSSSRWRCSPSCPALGSSGCPPACGRRRRPSSGPSGCWPAAAFARRGRSREG